MSELLRVLRRNEKAQTLFYRGLAAEAERAGEPDLVERLNELHADEQHHLSRLTARLLELGLTLDNLDDVSGPSADLQSWEPLAQEREAAEVASYEAALASVGDDLATHGVLAEILVSERLHAENLGGKWMPA